MSRTVIVCGTNRYDLSIMFRACSEKKVLEYSNSGSVADGIFSKLRLLYR